MKNLATILLTILIFISFKSYSQETESGILWVTVTSEDTKPIDDSITDNSTINSIFSQFGVYSFKQALPFAKTPELLNIYEILCNGDQHQLKLELEQNATEMLIKIKELEVPQLLFDPLDYFWQLQINNQQNYMWHLQKTEADLAWDITKGSGHIKIAVIDTPPDIEHPDLQTKIYPHYDPYTLLPYHAYTTNHFHGTAVCSFAAAQTQEFGSVNTVRPLSSMGFNTKLYTYSMGGSLAMTKALHASTVLNADVLTISWRTGCKRDETGTDSTIIKEILDNGTVIVAAAGNGFCSGCYNDSLKVSNCDSIPADFEHFSTMYPFSENYDDRIITVTSTDSLDYFTYYITDTASHSYNATHSYFPGVDVCAPGHHIMGAAPTLKDSCGIIVPNRWPFSGGCGGTSYATPIVAGLAALIKSINPCFTPEEVQFFIKSTTDTITDGYLYLDEYGNSQTGTGRINAYAAVSLAQQFANNIDVHIHYNETWTNDTTVNSIFIHSGGQLTIKSNVTFNNITSGIIVDIGGKLIIEGGHLNSCGSIWKGIEVWGNPDTTQNFPGLQGYAELKDSTIIENAKYGIVAYKIGDEKMNYTGGIIRAENTYFINNIKSIGFHPYQNIHPYYPSYEFNNASSFSNCSFIINHPKVYYYYGLADSTITEQWKAFIRLQGVKGININGCYFYNDKEITLNDTNIKINDYYTGILSFASGFSVDELCLVPYYPCDSSKTTKFNGLKYGIRAFALGKQKAVEIKNSEFTNCKTGVYIGGINNPVITSNVFKLINVDTTNLGNDTLLYKNSIFGGIYLDACSGYKIEENEINVFTGPSSTQINSIGIVINNSGEEYNEVYNNQIENLYVGILAQNINRGDSLGLCLKCNDLKKNEYDIAVTLDTNKRGWGIAQYQGSPENDITAPANNSFSTGTADYSDIYNDGERIDYFHTTNQPMIKLIPQLYSENVYPHLNPQDYSKDLSCPSSFGSGITPDAIESKIINSETIITNKNSELNSLVDGGDTEELNTDVQLSIPPEAMQVRQQLMNESPYLSDTVMKSAIDKENVLPNAMIRDVLVANPQSAKSDNVIEALDERFVQMPDYMMAQIMQGKNTTSAKENLEAEIQNWKGKNEKAYSNMLRYYKNDTTLNSFDSVVYWLQNQNTIDARYRLAFEYLSNNDTSLINSVLSGITNDFVLNSKQNLIHQDYLSYFQIMNALVSQGKSIMEADSVQIVSLQLLANNDKYLPGIYARNILIALAKTNYQEPYILPNPLKATDVDYYPLPELEKINYLKIFPNPARDYIVVEYNTGVENYLTDNGKQNIVLRFTDINGKLIQIKKLNKAKDQFLINTKTFNPGVYICSIFVDGKLIDTSKFTIY